MLFRLLHEIELSYEYLEIFFEKKKKKWCGFVHSRVFLSTKFISFSVTFS